MVDRLMQQTPLPAIDPHDRDSESDYHSYILDSVPNVSVSVLVYLFYFAFFSYQNHKNILKGHKFIVLKIKIY